MCRFLERVHSPKLAISRDFVCLNVGTSIPFPNVALTSGASVAQRAARSVTRRALRDAILRPVTAKIYIRGNLNVRIWTSIFSP
jgi:hypothetical protein